MLKTLLMEHLQGIALTEHLTVSKKGHFMVMFNT